MHTCSSGRWKLTSGSVRCVITLLGVAPSDCLAALQIKNTSVVARVCTGYSQTCSVTHHRCAASHVQAFAATDSQQRSFQ